MSSNRKSCEISNWTSCDSSFFIPLHELSLQTIMPLCCCSCSSTDNVESENLLSWEQRRELIKQTISEPFPNMLCPQRFPGYVAENYHNDTIITTQPEQMQSTTVITQPQYYPDQMSSTTVITQPGPYYQDMNSTTIITPSYQPEQMSSTTVISPSYQPEMMTSTTTITPSYNTFDQMDSTTTTTYQY